MADTYNGWTNYETWNAYLWLGNDEGLYHLARETVEAGGDYDTLVETLRELGSTETGDKVAWNDSGINRDEINEHLKEDFGEEAA